MDDRRHGWRSSFWLAAAATAVLALPWDAYARDYPPRQLLLIDPSKKLFLTENSEMMPKRPGRTPWRKLLTDKNLMSLTISYFAGCYFEGLFFYWFFYYFGQVRHFEPGRTAIYTAALFLTWTAMTPFGGWVSDHLAERYGPRAGSASGKIRHRRR